MSRLPENSRNKQQKTIKMVHGFMHRKLVGVRYHALSRPVADILPEAGEDTFKLTHLRNTSNLCMCITLS